MNDTQTTRQRLIEKLMETQEGRDNVAASMVAPLRLRIDHEGLHRIFSEPDEVPDEPPPGAFKLTWEDVGRVEIASGIGGIARLQTTIRHECGRVINEAVVAFLDRFAGEHPPTNHGWPSRAPR